MDVPPCVTPRYCSTTAISKDTQSELNRTPYKKITTTRIAGGLLLGYNPRVPGQGLKPLA